MYRRQARWTLTDTSKAILSEERISVMFRARCNHRSIMIEKSHCPMLYRKHPILKNKLSTRMGVRTQLLTLAHYQHYLVDPRLIFRFSFK